MAFTTQWTVPAQEVHEDLEQGAFPAFQRRKSEGDTKSSRIKRLFRQVRKTIDYLTSNPRHPSLKSDEYSAINNPVRPGEKVWEAYVQNTTPGAFRRISKIFKPNKNRSF